MTNYDAIIIGAGNGGLTTALKLARGGLKTLLLEQHNVPGGYATSFIRGRFEFEVALHQLSGVGTKENPGPLRSVFDDLGVTDKINFVHMDHLYRCVIPGEVDITLEADRVKMTESLKKQFPLEASNIEAFFELLYDFCIHWVSIEIFGDLEEAKKKYPKYFKYSLKSAQAVFEEFFKDQQLMTVLGNYSCYFGVPPSDLSFSNLALLIWEYATFKPAHVKGSSQALSNTLLNSYLEAGGEVKFNCAAKKIQVSDKKVVGVITEHGNEFSTNLVVSNASTLTTYTDMIDPEHIPDAKWRNMGSRTIGVSVVVAYIGFDCEPGDMDIHETTNFIVKTRDNLMDYSLTKSLQPPEGILFSCYDVDDPDFSPKGTCQAALLTGAYAEPWLKVPASEYYQTKNQYAQYMLDHLYQVFPKCKDHIEEIEVATPLTMMRYVGHPGGAIYGFDQFIKEEEMFLDEKSPIDGLYHVGCWAGTGGFQPAYESGYDLAKNLLKSGQ